MQKSDAARYDDACTKNDFLGFLDCLLDRCVFEYLKERENIGRALRNGYTEQDFEETFVSSSLK